MNRNKKYKKCYVKKKENKLLIILAAIFTGLVVIVTTLVFLIPKITEVKEVTIPDVTNMSIVDAEKEIEKYGLIVASENREEASSEIAEGNVTKTSPLAGQTVKEGTEVTLFVSTGENGYVVEEDLVGQNYLEVKGVLEKMYNLYVIVKRVEDDGNHNADEILSTEPAAGERLTEGDTITLYIPDMSTTYPDFTDGSYSLSEIEAWCEKYGVTLLPVYNQTDEYPAGTIYDQSQEAGSNVMNGQTLRLYISEEVAVEEGTDADVDVGMDDSLVTDDGV